jgi:two-component system OmpR family sensor kinase/two-component system sensor histidine kinase BaeS
MNGGPRGPWRRRHGPPPFFIGFLFLFLLILSVGAWPGGWLLARAVFIVLLFLLVMRRVGRPLGDVVGAADRVAQGDFAVRVRERGPPWLRSVARAFNSMTSRLERQQRQRRELMADVAHELRTPLAIMQGRLEGMIDGIYPRDERQVAQVLEDTRVLARLVEDLRTLAHAESGTLALQKEPTDVGVLLHDAIASLRSAADARRITLTVREASDLPLVEIDPVRIREVVTNIVANAVRYSPDGSEVVVEPRADGNQLMVTVRDSGTGIAPDDLPRIFDRFYKGAASSGSGLGLAIAHNLVKAHGGTITAQSREGDGTTITFSLPA